MTRDTLLRRVTVEIQATFIVATLIVGVSIYAAAGTHWFLKAIDRKRT